MERRLPCMGPVVIGELPPSLAAFPQAGPGCRRKLGGGSQEGRDNDIVRETFERTGASVMGKRMFDAGEKMWPEEAPFHTPVFVVTHEERNPWERPGGTTFHFVDDGIEP